MVVMVLSLQKGITWCGRRLHGTVWLYLVWILDCRSGSPAWNILPCPHQPEVTLRGRVEIHLQEHSRRQLATHCIVFGLGWYSVYLQRSTRFCPEFYVALLQATL